MSKKGTVNLHKLFFLIVIFFVIPISAYLVIPIAIGLYPFVSFEAARSVMQSTLNGLIGSLGLVLAATALMKAPLHSKSFREEMRRLESELVRLDIMTMQIMLDFDNNLRDCSMTKESEKLYSEDSKAKTEAQSLEKFLADAELHLIYTKACALQGRIFAIWNLFQEEIVPVIKREQKMLSKGSNVLLRKYSQRLDAIRDRTMEIDWILKFFGWQVKSMLLGMSCSILVGVAFLSLGDNFTNSFGNHLIFVYFALLFYSILSLVYLLFRLLKR